MNRVQNKVAVVTGGARGLGLAGVERLCQEGAKVLITDIDAKEGEVQRARLAGLGFDVAFEVQDVTQAETWGSILDGAITRWGRLDVLVNNAGVGFIGDIESCSLADWRKTLSINLDGVFMGTQTAIARMRVNGGSIINIASIEGIIGEPLVVAYNASKGGVRLLTKSAATHCARKGYSIRINNVCPGFVETQMVANAVAQLPPDAAKAWAETLIKRVPQGRFATPTEIAHAILFLASDESSYMTGSDLVIDGGYTAC